MTLVGTAFGYRGAAPPTHKTTNFRRAHGTQAGGASLKAETIMNFMKLLHVQNAFAAIVLMVFLTNCSKDNNERGKLSLKLTDAPASVEALNIQLSEIRLHRSGDDTSKGLWLSLPLLVNQLNLLDLQNTKDTLLFSGELPAGKITQVRFLLSSAEVVIIDTNTNTLDTLPLEIPSADVSGLKLILNEEISSDQDLTLTFDFDASESLIENGNGSFRFKPTIKLSKIEYLSSAQ